MDKQGRGGSGGRIRPDPTAGAVILGKLEKRRIIQLTVCLFLFLTMLISKGNNYTDNLYMELSHAVHQNIHTETAISNIEWSLKQGNSLLHTAQLIWTELFIPKEPKPIRGAKGPMYKAVRASGLTKNPAVLHVQEAFPAFNPMEHSFSFSEGSDPPTMLEPEVIHMDYTGPKLPDNATMDYYPLGLEETAVPVPGNVSSGFGWRDHPIEHVLKFHRGIDLTAAIGTPVLAFADGIVDYIGENEACGQYIQLRHNNGVTTFYCHCSKLCAQKGQSVSVGEKIAESGATGHVTGPHLHFELKKDGILIQPLYYIETE